MHKLVPWIVVLAALNIGVASVFGYDFLGDVFSNGTMQNIIGVVIGLSALVMAKDLLDSGE
jgi:uncharacterized membrane protein YuzA (DUF378 family)